MEKVTKLSHQKLTTHKERGTVNPLLVKAHLCSSCLFATAWTTACQAPLSMGFSRQENQSGLPFSPPGDLLYPGVEPGSLESPVFAGRFFTTEPPGKFNLKIRHTCNYYAVSLIYQITHTIYSNSNFVKRQIVKTGKTFCFPCLVWMTLGKVTHSSR